jgi:hypothetical protein
MSDYLFGQIKLGDIITFRYNDPKKRFGFNAPRTVMVLSPNYLGHLHAIKITGLSAAEQEYLQRLFQTAYTSPQNVFAPLEAQIQQRKKELDVLNKQRNEMLKNGQKVIVTPNSSELQFMDRAKQILGSVIGKVSTFGKTMVQGRANTDVQQQMKKHDQMIAQKKMELDSFVNNLNNQKNVLKNVPQVPTDPYHFSHMFFKAFIGNPRRMKMIYRKYNLSRINTPRIVKSVGIISNAR